MHVVEQVEAFIDTLLLYVITILNAMRCVPVHVHLLSFVLRVVLYLDPRLLSGPPSGHLLAPRGNEGDDFRYNKGTLVHTSTTRTAGNI